MVGVHSPVTSTSSPSHVVDLAFPVMGSLLPADHGYALYSALCRVIPSLHEASDIGIHPIQGTLVGDRLLAVNSSSSLTFRIPAVSIGTVLRLSGQLLDVDGHRCRLGVPRIHALSGTASLFSRLVVIKGFLTSESFLGAAQRQLDALGLPSTAELVSRSVSTSVEGKRGAQGPDLAIRRTLRVKDKTIVGFALKVSGLSETTSVKLQEQGIGGRRKLGCGVFVPCRP
jgi:CRISPR-associated protein Cas6